MSAAKHIKEHIQLGYPTDAAATIKQVQKDRRALSKWFEGGIENKTVVWSGDSTTENMTSFTGSTGALSATGASGAFQKFFDEFDETTVYALGTNGLTLASFLAGGGNSGKTLADVIALNPDCIVYCFGINDCRDADPTTGYSSTDLRNDLISLIDTTRASLPNVSIIMRMPNAHDSNAEGSGALIDTDFGASAQNCMDRYREAYQGLEGLYGNLVVWDAANVFPVVAPTTGNCQVLAADNFHPSNTGYNQTIMSIAQILRPVESDRDAEYYNANTYTSPLYLDPDINLLQWNQEIDPKILQGDDWYKVYRVLFEKQTDNSLYDLQIVDHLGTADSTAAAHATASVAPGLVIGDIVSFEYRNNHNGTFVINKAIPAASGNRIRFLYSSASNPEHPSKINAINDDLDNLPDLTYGYVFRHKYAFVNSMRYLQSLLATENQTAYEANTGVTNPYAVARRFYIVSAGAGSIRIQTIGSESGGDLSAKTWNASTDKLIIPGITGDRAGTNPADAVIDLTGATIDTTTYAASQQVDITGVTGVDFTKYVIPQGYVLSAA